MIAKKLQIDRWKLIGMGVLVLAVVVPGFLIVHIARQDEVVGIVVPAERITRTEYSESSTHSVSTSLNACEVCGKEIVDFELFYQWGSHKLCLSCFRDLADYQFEVWFQQRGQTEYDGYIGTLYGEPFNNGIGSQDGVWRLRQCPEN